MKNNKNDKNKLDKQTHDIDEVKDAHVGGESKRQGKHDANAEMRNQEKIAHNEQKQYWRKTMESSKHNKMSCGAACIAKCITSAHGDNWRRGREKKK